MTESYVTIGGYPAVAAELFVPRAGAWYVDVDCEVDPEVSGRVVVELGDLRLSGTVAAASDGTRGIQRKTRVVGGAGGWGTLVPPKAYAADNGLSASLVANDAARVAGETITEFAPSSPTVGRAYVRSAGPAARVLDDVIGSALWWVDYDGNTHVGQRSTSSPSVEYQVIDYDPRDRFAEIATTDLSSIVIGSVLTEDLDEPQTVRELRIVVTGDTCRVYAWTGGADSSRGQLADAFARAVARSTPDRIYGKRRYRVVRMVGNRVELQAVRRDAGLPDISPASVWPGIAGVHADLTPSAEVLVEFIEGDRTMPIVTHFAGKDGVGFVPVRIDIGKDPTSYIALATKTDAVVRMLFDLLAGLAVVDPTTGLPIPGFVPWNPIGSFGDAAGLKALAVAIGSLRISSASGLVRST